MTFDELINEAVHDAVLEAAFDKPAYRDALAACMYDLKNNTRKRLSQQLQFNHLRELMHRRRPKDKR